MKVWVLVYHHEGASFPEVGGISKTFSGLKKMLCLTERDIKNQLSAVGFKRLRDGHITNNGPYYLESGDYFDCYVEVVEVSE